jgi:hypothetical protein
MKKFMQMKGEYEGDCEMEEYMSGEEGESEKNGARKRKKKIKKTVPHISGNQQVKSGVKGRQQSAHTPSLSATAAAAGSAENGVIYRVNISMLGDIKPFKLENDGSELSNIWQLDFVCQDMEQLMGYISTYIHSIFSTLAKNHELKIKIKAL